jgi:hypothetical protein
MVIAAGSLAGGIVFDRVLSMRTGIRLSRFGLSPGAASAGSLSFQ